MAQPIFKKGEPAFSVQEQQDQSKLSEGETMAIDPLTQKQMKDANGKLMVLDQNFTTPDHFELYYNGTVLKYAVKFFKVQGTPKPQGGYPIYIGLHGGGGQWVGNNDSEWTGCFNNFWSNPIEQYAKQVQQSTIFICPRGISERQPDGTYLDRWNLHFQPEGYVMIQQMIKRWFVPLPNELMMMNAIDPNDSVKWYDQAPFCNSNRVHLLGFSAGGDGAFQMAARLPDLFASVFVGGGHSNGVSFNSIMNTPLYVACGELDGTPAAGDDTSGVANRAQANWQDYHTIGVLKGDVQNNYMKPSPSSLAAAAEKLYTFEYTIIKDKGHNAWAQPGMRTVQQNVVANLDAWENKTPGWDQTKPELVDPEQKVGPETRNPYPNFVCWDLKDRPTRPAPNGAPWFSKNTCYWLCLRTPTGDTDNLTGTMRASYDRSTNSVWVDQPLDYLGFMLNDTMLNLDQPIKILWGASGTELDSITVSRSEEIKTSCASCFQDPNLSYVAIIGFKNTAGVWKAELVNELGATFKTS